MSGQRLLISGGLILAAIGMIYGLHYALFIEHQTLGHMGATLTQAFVAAGDRNFPESDAALAAYTRSKYVYLRQVDAHSHWIGLGMLLIALGAFWKQVAFSKRTQLCLAITLLAGAFTFPLGVLLQTTMAGPITSAVAVGGSALIIIDLVLIIIGFARTPAP
jgi:hypothetical protein